MDMIAEYLNGLKDGERVIETGQSGLFGRLGIVCRDHLGGPAVKWDKHEDDIPQGQMTTSATHGTRRFFDVDLATRQSDLQLALILRKMITDEVHPLTQIVLDEIDKRVKVCLK